MPFHLLHAGALGLRPDELSQCRAIVKDLRKKGARDPKNAPIETPEAPRHCARAALCAERDGKKRRRRVILARAARERLVSEQRALRGMHAAINPKLKQSSFGI